MLYNTSTTPFCNLFQYQLQLKLKALQPQKTERQSLQAKQQLVQDQLIRMNAWLRSYTFSQADEEIYFFKTIRSDMVAQLLFYNTLLHWDAKIGLSTAEQEAFYIKKYKKVNAKIKRLKYLKDYFENQLTAYDHGYFTRQTSTATLAINTPEYFNYDLELCTPECLPLAQYKRWKLLKKYLKQNISHCKNKAHPPAERILWPDAGLDPYELTHSLYEVLRKKNKQIKIQQIARGLEQMFQIEISPSIYKKLPLLKKRKSEQVQFLPQLTEALQHKLASSKNR